MVRHRSIQPILVSVLTVAVFFVGTTTTLVAQPAPTPPGNHLNITEVAVDFDTSMIVITGEHFSFGNTLEVTLGEFGPLNIVGVPTDTEIVVDFPAGGFPDGVKDYLLTVSRGNGQGQNDEYDLTVLGGNGGGNPPLPSECPCIGTMVDGTFAIWSNEFAAQTCLVNTTEGRVSTRQGAAEAALLLDSSADFTCTVAHDPDGFFMGDPTTFVDVFGLTPNTAAACADSLRQIAANDGVECTE